MVSACDGRAHTTPVSSQMAASQRAAQYRAAVTISWGPVRTPPPTPHPPSPFRSPCQRRPTTRPASRDPDLSHVHRRLDVPDGKGQDDVVQTPGRVVQDRPKVARGRLRCGTEQNAVVLCGAPCVHPRLVSHAARGAADVACIPDRRGRSETGIGGTARPRTAGPGTAACPTRPRRSTLPTHALFRRARIERGKEHEGRAARQSPGRLPGRTAQDQGKLFRELRQDLDDLPGQRHGCCPRKRGE